MLPNNKESTSTSPLNCDHSINCPYTKEEVERKINKWKKELLQIVCPISKQLMLDPVTIKETGQTYDRNSIAKWFQTNNTCPITGKQLSSKSFTPNFILKSVIDENIRKFIIKIIKHIKIWYNNINLHGLCYELIDESLYLINNDIDFKKQQLELNELKLDILLKEKDESKLWKSYVKLINEIKDMNFKILQLQKLEKRLTGKYNLFNYYCEILRLLIEYKKNDNLLKEIFIKYCITLDSILNEKYIIPYHYSRTFNQLLTDILNYLAVDDIKLDYLIILFNNNRHFNNSILKALKTIKISENKKEEFISFFKQFYNKISFTRLNLTGLIDFIKDYNELNEEKFIIYKQLFKEKKDIKYLELAYELQNDKETGTQLLNEYLKLNLHEKYLQVFVKINENNLHSFNIVLCKLLQKQNIEIEKIIMEKNDLEKEVSKLTEWKNQQIIENFKIKYPEYDYVNIIKIETPLNVMKEEKFFSDTFEVFGLKWSVCIYPKGESKSNEEDCSIYLHLNSLQYEKQTVFSVSLSYFMTCINLSDNFLFYHNFTEGITSFGSLNFKQFNFVPIIKNGQQTFNIVIGMKKLDLKFKILNNPYNIELGPSFAHNFDILEKRYKSELNSLFSMGFLDKSTLLRLLEKHKGNITVVIKEIFTD